MKKSDYFAPLLGNAELKQNVTELLEANRVFHASLILGEDGCGKNFFAKLFAAAYLEDEGERVARGVHPDCITVAGSGASGEIAVDDIRAAVYELNKAAVISNGRRVAIVKDAYNLNQSSSNALLKVLEAPPKDVIFLITARYESELLATILSRCARYYMSPLSEDVCKAEILRLYPKCDKTRAEALCSLYGGRLGLVKNALSSPERLALCDCASRFCEAALKGDKLSVLSELENAPTRDELRAVLYDASAYLQALLQKKPQLSPSIEKVSSAVSLCYGDIARNINLKLLCTELAAQL